MDDTASKRSFTRKKSGGSDLHHHMRRSSTSSVASAPGTLTGERTVKRLRMSKALTVPENTTVQEACRRMVARRVDALLITDSNALLCGILTDKDIAKRVIAQGLKVEDTPVSKIMTRNPVFVLSDSLSLEALQKMVVGNFRHLPVVENGEVIGLLDIAKCLYDAIARMERAVEKGKAIAAAVEGVEKRWGTSISGPNTFLESLQERMFRPSISTIVNEKTKVASVSPTDSVTDAAKKMSECHTSSAVITVGNKPQGIITSKDILMRVIAQDLSPESTVVEKVMTPNPECATVDTPIVDALHIMHDGRFLHLPVVDRDGIIVAVVDVLQVTHAAVSMVGNVGGTGSETTSTMMQKFWDSAMSMSPFDDEDSRSEGSIKQASESTDTGKLSYLPGQVGTFAFKIEDKMGRMHKFYCETGSLTALIAAIIQRVGDDIDRNHLPDILYEDEDNDKILLSGDGDLAAAVEHARQLGWKALKLHLDNSNLKTRTKPTSSRSGGNISGSGGNISGSGGVQVASRDAWAAAYSTVAASAALVAGLGVVAFLRRGNS